MTDLVDVVIARHRKTGNIADTNLLLLYLNVPVLTDDFDLDSFLSKRGVDVLNFNHIRPLGWRM